MNILERLVKAATRHPIITILIVLGITALAAIPALKLTIDTSLEGFYESDDPDFLAAEAVEEQFGGGNMVVVVIGCSDSNAYTAKAYAKALANKLEKDSHWEDVQYKKDLSFAAEKGILYLPEEQFAALMDPHAAPEMLGALPSSTLEKATLSEYIVSDNKKIYLVTMGFSIDEENPMERNYLLDDLGRLITETREVDKDYEALNVGFTGGLMVIDYEGDKMAMQDIYLTAFITLILILILLFVSFRSLSLPHLSIVPCSSG